MRQIIDEEGLTKVENMVAAKNLNKATQDLMDRYFTFAKAYQIEGARS